MPRKMKKAKVRFISLVPKGANRMPVIYKSDGAVEFDTLLINKNMDEGELTAVVYAPDNVDAQGDYAPREVIKQMAHDFARSGEGVDLMHNNTAIPKDKVWVAESFIIQKNDPRFSDLKDYDGNAVDVEGAWGVTIKIDDEELRKEYREGKWNGVSMGGMAVFEKEDSDDSLIKKLIKALLGSSSQQDQSSPSAGEIDMTSDELKKVLGEQTAAITEAISKALSSDKKDEKGDDYKETKKGDTTPEPVSAIEDGVPVFKGDITNPKHVKEHKIALAKHAIVEKFDMTDPEQFEQASAEIAKALDEINGKKADKPGSNAGYSPVEKSDKDAAEFARKFTQSQYAKKGA